MRTVFIAGFVMVFAAYAVAAQVAEDRITISKTATGQHQKEDSENNLLVESVLLSSHKIAVQLSPTERVEVLVRLANAAGKKHPERARQWALEALQLADKMHPTAQRAQYEIEAISDLASVNSGEALALLPGLEVPASWTDCDGRGKAARQVFQEFLNQHPGEWEKLSAVAQRIGDTGNYPYQAVQIVVGRIGSKNQEAAATLMQQAIRYYDVSAPGPCSNNQLATLLVENSSFVPGSTLKAILEVMLSNLLKAEDASSESIAKAGAPAGEDARLGALNSDTLATLMPLIESMDPEMERKLRQEYPSIHLPMNVAGGQEGEPNTVGPATAPPAESSSEESLKAPPSDLDEHSEEEDSLQSIQTLPEDSARPQEALNNDPGPEQRLQALVERGVSLVSSEQWAELSDVLADAFALGEKLFRKSVDEDPQASWRSRPGADGLSTLVETAAKKVPREVLEKIRNLHTSVLQAQLYVSFVEGIQSEWELPSVVAISTED